MDLVLSIMQLIIVISLICDSYTVERQNKLLKDQNKLLKDQNDSILTSIKYCTVQENNNFE